MPVPGADVENLGLIIRQHVTQQLCRIRRAMQVVLLRYRAERVGACSVPMRVISHFPTLSCIYREAERHYAAVIGRKYVADHEYHGLPTSRATASQVSSVGTKSAQPSPAHRDKAPGRSP